MWRKPRKNHSEEGVKSGDTSSKKTRTLGVKVTKVRSEKSKIR